MGNTSIIVLSMSTLFFSGCKTTDAAAPKSEVSSTPAEPAQTSHVNCSNWAGDGSAAFTFEASGSDENATLQTAKLITTRLGQIPVGTYKMVDGSPSDGTCLEYYADISVTIKSEDTESSGLIISNCDVAEESEWHIKAYVRRVEGQAAEMIFDERYSCSIK